MWSFLSFLVIMCEFYLALLFFFTLIKMTMNSIAYPPTRKFYNESLRERKISRNRAKGDNV